MSNTVDIDGFKVPCTGAFARAMLDKKHQTTKESVQKTLDNVAYALSKAANLDSQIEVWVESALVANRAAEMLRGTGWKAEVGFDGDGDNQLKVWL
jgi:hypothetical protein